MAEVAEEETKICSTCERNIGVSKIRMHEIGCARNNYKCRECGDVVAKADREEHEETAHKPVKCQYCPHTAPAATFGNHEETCELKPKQCQYCEQIFRVEIWVDHVEACGNKTNKCEDCQQYVKKKNWEEHKVTNECAIFKEEQRRKEIQEQQRKLEELEKFREEEETQRKKMQAKREAKEREQAAEMARIEKEKEAWRKMNEPKPNRGVAARAGASGRENPTIQNLKPDGPSRVGRSAIGSAKPVITNTRKSATRTNQQPGMGQVPKPSTRAAMKDEEMKNHVVQMSVGGRVPKPSNTGRTAMASNLSNPAGGVGVRRSGPNKVTTGVSRPSPSLPGVGVSQQSRHSGAGQHNVDMMDEDAQTAAAIAAALDEDESEAIARRMQEEAYTGGGLSARGGADGGSEQPAFAQNMMQYDNRPDEAGVRAARPQVMDQMIGGGDDGPMIVDQPVQQRPDRFGAGARDNFPSGFEDSQWGRAAAGDGGASMNMGGTTSAADLERALAASMEQNLPQNRNQMDEDAELARILEASKHER